jgi:Zn ribbon nucleic-acid-binding protein
MPKEPLYPHVPRKPEPLYPHKVEQEPLWKRRLREKEQKPPTDVYHVPEWTDEVRGIFVGGCVKRGPGSSFRAKAHAHNDTAGPWFGWICVRSLKRIGETQGQTVTNPSRLLWHEYAHLLTPNHGHDDAWRRKMTELHQPIKEQYRKKKREYKGSYGVMRWCPNCKDWVQIWAYNARPGYECPKCGSVTVNKP